jgi:hypothetical protein
MSQLFSLISLYRELGRPEINENATIVCKNVNLTQELITCFIDVWSENNGTTNNIEVKVGTDRLSGSQHTEQLKESLNKVAARIDITLDRHDSSQFYDNTYDFIQRCKCLNYGELPSSFYIADIDYKHGGTSSHQKPSDIGKIEHFCELISLLKRACHFIDTRLDTHTEALLIIPDIEGKNSAPKKIKLNFSANLLNINEVDFQFLKQIIESDKNSHHRQEKLSLFRISLWDVISDANKNDIDVISIVENWQKLESKYHHSYELYVSGFSFSKFKGEVQDFIHSSIQKANNLLGDIVIKTLAVPSLFSVWLLLLRSQQVDSVFILGLFVTLLFSSIIVIFVIDNQQFLVNQLEDYTKNTFSDFKSKSDQTLAQNTQSTAEIIKFIRINDKKLCLRISSIKRRLLAIRIVIWFFILVAFFVTIEHVWPYQISTTYIYALFFSLIITFYVFIQIILKSRSTN